MGDGTPRWVTRWSDENGLGIEWELGIVDRTTLALVDHGGSRVIEAVRAEDPTATGWLHDELFTHTVEAVTPPSATVRDAVTFLGDKVGLVSDAAERMRCRLFSAGSHPFSKAENYTVTPTDPRRANRTKAIGTGPAAMQIWSVHIHVGVTSEKAAIAAMRELHAHIPYFLALSGSSPFWEGKDTELLSSRPSVYATRPFRGTPPLFDTFDQYDRTLTALSLTKRISHPKDVHWEVRITPHGTVELRVCDALASLEEIGAMAALAQTLVARAEDGVKRGLPLREIDEVMFDGNRRMAMRYGMGARFVTPDGDMRRLRERLPELLADLRPYAHEHGCESELGYLQEMSDRYERDERLEPAGARMREAARGRHLREAVRLNADELEASLQRHRARSPREHPLRRETPRHEAVIQ